MKWPIGAHWCQRAYREAHDLGLSFCWLNADGLSDDARSREIADTDGYLSAPMDYILLLHLSSEDRLLDRDGVWERHLKLTLDRLQSCGVLGRMIGAQLDDEWYTNRAFHRGRQAMRDAAPHVAARAEDVRRIFGPHVGQGVGMAEPGGIVPPLDGIDWWSLNVYLAPGYYRQPEQVASIYRVAASIHKPLMPVIPLFVDGDHRTPTDLDTLARCYLPLLEQHAASIWSVGVFCLHHPSTWDPLSHVAGRGVLELGPGYQAGVRVLTERYGASPSFL